MDGVTGQGRDVCSVNADSTVFDEREEISVIVIDGDFGARPEC